MTFSGAEIKVCKHQFDLINYGIRSTLRGVSNYGSCSVNHVYYVTLKPHFKWVRRCSG